MILAHRLLLAHAGVAATAHYHTFRVLLHLILIVNRREVVSDRVALGGIVTRIVILQFLLLMIVQFLQTLFHFQVRVESEQFLA